MSIWHEYDLPELEELQGPSQGTVVLPINLYWTMTGYPFDLNTISGLANVYGSVFSEGSKEDIIKYINRDLLIDNWDWLSLPKAVMEKYDKDIECLKIS